MSFMSMQWHQDVSGRICVWEITLVQQHVLVLCLCEPVVPWAGRLVWYPSLDYAYPTQVGGFILLLLEYLQWMLSTHTVGFSWMCWGTSPLPLLQLGDWVLIPLVRGKWFSALVSYGWVCCALCIIHVGVCAARWPHCSLVTHMCQSIMWRCSQMAHLTVFSLALLDSLLDLWLSDQLVTSAEVISCDSSSQHVLIYRMPVVVSFGKDYFATVTWWWSAGGPSPLVAWGFLVVAIVIASGAEALLIGKLCPISLQQTLARRCPHPIMSSELWLDSLGEFFLFVSLVNLRALDSASLFEDAELLMDPPLLRVALRSALSTYTSWFQLGIGLVNWGGRDPHLFSGCCGCDFQFSCLAFTSRVTCFSLSPSVLFTSRATSNHRENEDLMMTETNLRWNPAI